MVDDLKMSRKPLEKLSDREDEAARGQNAQIAGDKSRITVHGKDRDDGSFEYVARNAVDLYTKYPDSWILVDKARVVNSASEPEELIRLALSLGIKDPFITLTSPPERPGKAIY